MHTWENETPEQTRIRSALIHHPKAGAGPSSRNPWVGTPVEGSRWTVEQISTLKKLGKDPDGKVWSHQVPLWMPNPNDPFDIYTKIYVRCPALARTGDRSRVKVIAPDGVIYWTDAQ